MRAALLLVLASMLGSAIGCTSGAPSRTPDASGSGLDGSIDDGGPRPDRAFTDTGFLACETTSAFAEPLPATLAFQLDTSGSMNCAASATSCVVGDPTPDPSDSRYDVFRAQLVAALDALPDSTSAGLFHYPNPDTGCAISAPDVAIAPLSTSRAAIGTALAGIVPENITPTHDAVALALAALRASGGENRYLVLATDGAATVCLGCDAGCSWDALDADNEQLIDDVAAAAAEGIPTFVIGVPGSQSYRAILSRMASAAGTARAGCSDAGPTYCHFDLTDPAIDFASGLRDALGAIGDAVLSCEYEIPPNPEGTFDPGQVNVHIVDESGTDAVIPRDPSRTDGWDYDDSGTRIVIHGASCERARALRRGRIDVLYGCPTILI